MLREIRQVKQEAVGRRRWFEDEDLELIVWYDAANALEGFQLCDVTNAGRSERALTWRPNAGFTHAQVDAGDTNPLKNETPVLRPDGAVPWAEIETVFGERSAGLEAGLRELILGRLKTRR